MRTRPGYKQIATQAPVEVLAGMEALAKANGRSLTDEITHAMERHLSCPPTVRVEVIVPEFPPAEVIREPEKPKRARKLTGQEKPKARKKKRGAE